MLLSYENAVEEAHFHHVVLDEFDELTQERHIVIRDNKSMLHIRLAKLSHHGKLLIRGFVEQLTNKGKAVFGINAIGNKATELFERLENLLTSKSENEKTLNQLQDYVYC